jgi:hypothetical protein
MAVPFVRAWYRATPFGAYAYVGRPAISVLAKAQFCDGHHNLAFSREHFAKKPSDMRLAEPPGGRRRLPQCVQVRMRGHRLEAARLALPLRPLA